MAYPKKFKELLETELSDIENPDYVWLTYAVCGCDKDACGWTLEAVFLKTEEHYPTGTGDKSLSSNDESPCPACGKELFRTSASVRLEPSKDQAEPGGVAGVDYEVAPMEYE